MAFKIPFEKHVSLATVKKVHGWYTVTTSRNIWWCSSILTTASTNHLFCTVSSLWSWGFVLRRCLHFCRYFYTLILTGLLCPAALVVSVHVSVYVGRMFDKCTAGVGLFQGNTGGNGKKKKKKPLANSYQQQAVHSNKPGSKIGFKTAHGPTCATHLSSASAQEITHAAGLLAPRSAHHRISPCSAEMQGVWSEQQCGYVAWDSHTQAPHYQ